MTFSTGPVEIVNGSHRAELTDTTALVRDVSIFGTNDISAKLGKVDRERLKAILTATNDRASRGAFPQIKLGHDASTNAPSYGRLVNIRMQNRVDEAVIIADFDMSRNDFETLVRSNRYPRRSAEIWPDTNELSEIGLLGGKTPALPLEDTHFQREGRDVAVFCRSGDALIYGDDSMTMTASEIIAAVKGMDTSQRAEFAKLVTFESDAKSDDKEKMAEDEEDEEDESKKSKSSRQGDTLTATRLKELEAKVAKYERERSQSADEIATLREAIRYERLVNELERMRDVEGFSLDVTEEAERLAKFSKEQADAEIERIKKNYKRVEFVPGDLIGSRLDRSGLRTGTADGPTDSQRHQAEKFAREHDDTDYATALRMVMNGTAEK